MSTSLIDMLVQQVGTQLAPQASRQLGSDRAATQAALQAAIPVLVSALAQNASRPEGAASLQRALDRDHDGTLLDDVSELAKNWEGRRGDGILGHVLGSRRGSVERQVASHSGLDAATVAKLLAMAAPLVMAAIARARRGKDEGKGGLAGMLAEERRGAASDAGGLGGLLTQFLDKDGDGSAADDVLKSAIDMIGGTSQR